MELIADNFILRFDIMSKTRSSSKAEGEGCLVNLDEKIEAFMKSDVFRAVLSTAINVAVEAAIKCFKNEFVNLIDVRMKALEDTNTRLKCEVAELHRKLGEVDAKANENEQYSRRNNLRFYGITEKETEDCYDEVVKFCDRELGVVIERSEIDRAHRIGKPQHDNGRPRAIIIKLKSFHSKISILKNKRRLRGKSLYVNEDLTRINQQLLMYAKEKCRDTASVYTSDGHIFVKRKYDGTISIIKRKEDLSTYS